MNIDTIQWIANIVGSVISGSICIIITRFFFSRENKKEHDQTILAANREVLYAIRPSVSEGDIPKSTIIKQLITATARKYGVEQSSMLTISELSADLIKEVMDSSFVPTNTKIDLCEKLSMISEEEEKRSNYLEKKIERNTSIKHQQSASYFLGFITSVSTCVMLTTYSIKYSFVDLSGISFKEIGDYAIVIASVPAALAGMLCATVLIYSRNNKKKRLNAEDDNEFDR